jgi:hypothetical protein
MYTYASKSLLVSNMLLLGIVEVSRVSIGR